MRKKHREPSSEREIKRELSLMGVDVFEPETRSEETLARIFEDFADFVLRRERERCLGILRADAGYSVGELQGGTDEISIYRVAFPIAEYCNSDEDKECNNRIRKRDGKNAALRLLDCYNERGGRCSRSTLTVDKIGRYMLGMCDRRTRVRDCAAYESLGNLMLIMQFGGPTNGQVRHIDNMVPNVQICLYMSRRCPSTVVHSTDDGDGPPVTDGASLVDFWERRGDDDADASADGIVPEPIRDILLRHGDRPMKSKWYTKSHQGWRSINAQLRCFGRLYQPVSHQLGLLVEPGTTLLAGGNEIHAGPPTTESRMFAFAIGIPDGEDPTIAGGQQNESDFPSYGDGENDGEVQYSPVLLHVDFCCLLFGMLDYEYRSESADAVREAKRFLVTLLVELIRDYPMKEYLLQIDEDRAGVRNWLDRVLTLMENGQSVDGCIEEAVDAHDILYSPAVVKRRSKRKKYGARKSLRIPNNAPKS